MDLKKLLANDDEITVLEKVTGWFAQNGNPHQEEQNPDSCSWTPTLDRTQQGDTNEMPSRSSTKHSQGEPSEDINELPSCSSTNPEGGETEPRELLMQYKHARKNPIFLKLDVDADTPFRVKELIRILPLHEQAGVAVIPGSLQGRLENDDDIHSPPAHAFDVTRDSWDAGELAQDTELLTLAKDIISNANELFLNNGAEMEWQTLAEDLLRQVIRLTESPQRLQMKFTSNAIIDERLLPEGAQGCKVDLALAFSTRDETTQKAYGLFQNAQPFLLTGPYVDPALSRMIFPVCIEVGGLEVATAEPNLRTAVWAAASLQKFEDLRNAVLPELSADDVPPLVVFTCIARNWNIHIAYRNKRNQASVLLGGWDCGGYRSLYQMFWLLSTLKRIIKWAVEGYWPCYKPMIDALERLASGEAQ